MSGLETRTCSRCGVTAEQVPIGRLISEPMGWTNLTISGLPVTNMRLCPPCTRDVRVLVTATPTDLMAAREADLSRAFRDGYEDGCDDTERSHVCGCPDVAARALNEAADAYPAYHGTLRVEHWLRARAAEAVAV